MLPVKYGAHSLFALAAFLGFNLEAIAVAAVVSGPMRAVSALAGIIGLVNVGLMIAGDAGTAAAFGPIGHGGTERMIVYPAMLWMLALGGHLMAAGDDGAGVRIRGGAGVLDHPTEVPIGR